MWYSSGMKKLAKIGLGAMSGFGLFWLTSHPKSKAKQKLPKVAFKNFTFIPNIKLKSQDQIYHLHHWVLFSVVYVLLFLVKRRLFRFSIIHGAILGIIIQGLTYPDRFRFSARG